MYQTLDMRLIRSVGAIDWWILEYSVLSFHILFRVSIPLHIKYEECISMVSQLGN